MNAWGFLGAAIIAEIAATLCLKAALDQPWFYVVVVGGYTAAFLFLSLALRAGMPLGVGYGIWGAVGVGATALLSNVFFSEPITVLMAIGILFVIAGVVFVESAAEESPDPKPGAA